MKRISVVLPAVFVLFICACSTPVDSDGRLNETIVSKSPDSRSDSDVVFFSSFESPSDSTGWLGYGGFHTVEDFPTGGGSRSLEISGGCIHPHAITTIVGPSVDGELRIECWGKNLVLGGGVSLYRLADPSKRISLFVSESTWTFLRSEESLFVRAGDSLAIEMSSGGIAYSAMRIDLLAVRRVMR
jgi:hypothetical protein